MILIIKWREVIKEANFVLMKKKKGNWAATTIVLLDKKRVRKESQEVEIESLQILHVIPKIIILNYTVKIPKLTSIVDNQTLIILIRVNQVNLYYLKTKFLGEKKKSVIRWLHKLKRSNIKTMQIFKLNTPQLLATKKIRSRFKEIKTKVVCKFFSRKW